jgi:hypothetical protein
MRAALTALEGVLERLVQNSAARTQSSCRKVDARADRQLRWWMGGTARVR